MEWPTWPSSAASCTRLSPGAGCSHGLKGTNNSIILVNSDGTWSQVANLSAFQKNHPVANPEPDDFEPDGTWYGMVAAGHVLYAVEPNHGELDTITTDGQIRRVADISHIEGHIVPTAIAWGGANFFVGNLERFPIQGETSKVLKITPDGNITTQAIEEGLSGLVGQDVSHVFVETRSRQPR